MSQAEPSVNRPEQDPKKEEENTTAASQVTPTENNDSFGAMLSLSFETPLAGAARSEKIKQMSNNHDAFKTSRQMQQVLVRIQHSLRRMPGVSSTESSDMVQQLQEVGQTISQETSALVDAVMNLTLDQEDTDKAVARMSIEANITKARIEEQNNLIRKLQDKSSSGSDGSPTVSDMSSQTKEDKDEIIRRLREANTHLEEQVNGRRSLWVMKHPDEQSVSRAIANLRDSANGSISAQGALMSLKQTSSRPHTNNRAASSNTDPGRDFVRQGVDMDTGLASPDVYSRPSHQLPIGSFRGVSGPPARPPSTAPFSRRTNTNSNSSSAAAPAPWDQPQSSTSSRGPPYSNGGGSSFAISSFGRGGGSVGRKTFPSQGSSRFSPSAAEFYPWNPSSAENGTESSNTSMNGGHNGGRQASSSFGSNGGGGANTNGNGNSRDYYPRTPTNTSRGRYGRLQDAPPSGGSDTPGGGVSLSSAMVSSRPPAGNTTASSSSSSALLPLPSSTQAGSSASSSSLIAPLVHMNERSVAAWHSGIMDFYAVIRAFVERHASQPDHASSMKMSSTTLWPILLATYHPLSSAEAASYLEYHLRNENSKACLVTRVMIDYIVNRVWTPAAWSGADEESTYNLMELERDMERVHGQPSAFRQPLLDRQASIIDAILAREHPSTSSFHRAKIDEVAGTLLANLQPLLNRLANPADACRDMEQVAEHAWDLSSRILTSRLTFDFRFPEIGSRFSSQSMLPIWPRMDPFELQAKHWRVALVTTPVITCRNDTGTNISAHSVSLADVFCMH